MSDHDFSVVGEVMTFCCNCGRAKCDPVRAQPCEPVADPATRIARRLRWIEILMDAQAVPRGRQKWRGKG